jgi:hypothetical protein
MCWTFCILERAILTSWLCTNHKRKPIISGCFQSFSLWCNPITSNGNGNGATVGIWCLTPYTALIWTLTSRRNRSTGLLLPTKLYSSFFTSIDHGFGFWFVNSSPNICQSLVFSLLSAAHFISAFWGLQLPRNEKSFWLTWFLNKQ